MNRIRDDIKKREFHNLYLLYGDEEYLKRYYRENLKYCILEDSDDMNFSKFENKGIDLNEVQSIADTFSVSTVLLSFRTADCLSHQMILRTILSICPTARLLFLWKKR